MRALFAGSALLLAVLPAQLTVTGLADLDAIAARARAQLAEAPAPDSRALLRQTIGWLRLGRPHRARALLNAHTAPDDVVYALAALASYVRCTGDHGPTASLLPGYEARLRELEAAPPPASFAAAGLQAHARCCAALLGPAVARSEQLLAATRRWLPCEEHLWLPQHEHFFPGGAPNAPGQGVPADASLWQPLAAGMLLATGDRLGRHLRATLAAWHSRSPARWRRSLPVADESALAVIAAQQLGDPERLRQAWRTLRRHRPRHPTTAALQLDAALLAITGVRVAAGAGHGERWLRIAPWLPDGVHRVRIEGLHAQKTTLSLGLRRTCRGLSVEVHTDAEHPVALVVSNRRQQYLTRIANGEPFRCLLDGQAAASARQHREPQHDRAEALRPPFHFGRR